MLELESDLEKERIRLAELRKKHYQLAGESEGWDVEDQVLPCLLPFFVNYICRQSATSYKMFWHVELIILQFLLSKLKTN